ncbi:hypothetical protein LMG29542_07910 [Paraburkholderia humisilvae]|uniref:Uncharacterized protein n=1 Tax=Paraburkholderia humisilvae TaxID=627669 RepID=A0A6J5F830_9BURK|nr:hypothetical protein LMG29542_07910 [Paraburkholderia humisilvae]
MDQLPQWIAVPSNAYRRWQETDASAGQTNRRLTDRQEDRYQNPTFVLMWGSGN